MAKKKKKVSDQAIQKLQLAQNMNEFKRSLHQFFVLVGQEELYALLPDRHIGILFGLRSTSIKVKGAEGHVIPEILPDYVKTLIKETMDDEMIEVFEGVAPISFTLYYKMALPVAYMLEKMQDNDFKGAKELKEKLPLSKPIEETEIKVLTRINTLLDLTASIYSNMGEMLFSIAWTSKKASQKTTHLENVFTISSYRTDRRYFSVDGISRPAIRVAWIVNKMLINASIKNGLLNKKSSFPDLPVEVYIQLHALHRMHERMGFESEHNSHRQLFIQFVEDPKVIDEGNNTFLIEYQLFDCKAGYLVANLIDGALLIRTFLFVTHAGTPEGKKLTELTGLQKQDQKYLALDNLLAFANSDVFKNPEIKELFKKAGCGTLIDLCEHMKNFDQIWKHKEMNDSLAEAMIKYMQVEKQETTNN